MTFTKTEAEPTFTPPLTIRRSTGRLRIVIVGAIILAVMAFLLLRGLGNATMYFRTADQAITERQTLGEKRFRIEGVVVQGSLRKDGVNTNFDISSKTTIVQVDNKAATQGIFREGIPVVLEGHFEHGTNTFLSDRIMVKHDSSYTAAHPDRVSGDVGS